MPDKETKNLENGEDCPAELVNLFDGSKSAWRKGVIKQFIELYNWRIHIKHKLERIEKMEKIIITLLIVIVGVAFKEIVPSIIDALMGFV